MGQVNRDSLQSFLSGHIQDRGMVSRLMVLLEPFFQRAESGVYQLALEAELDPEKIRAAIARATGQKVTRIVFVSRGCPFPKPPWMTEDIYQNSLWASLRASLCDSLWASLWASLRASLCDSLWASLMDSLRASLGDSLRDSLMDSLWNSLFYLLGFAIAGRTGVVERLVPLIELLPKAIPLGVKRDEPGVWVVLAA